MSTPTDDAPSAPTNPVTLIGPGAPGFYGPFVVLEKLGEGGMGAVYLAQDSRLKRQVAIKTMRAELSADPVVRRRFEREARAAAAVEHDNIVPILHVGEAIDGTPFIVMPFLKGEPLNKRLKRERFAPLPLILKVAREVAEGLAAAHATGLIHRDIKPGNIWLEGDPSSPAPVQQVRRCRILDFGLARAADGTDTNMTASGAVLGTPAYMSPEQARGEKVDARGDLWGLGATLYRMATGRAPFEGPTPMAVLIALATEDPRPVRELAPHLPPDVGALIAWLMDRDRERRPRSAAAVSATVGDLNDRTTGAWSAAPAPHGAAPDPESLADSIPQETTEQLTPPPVRRRRPQGRRRWPLAVAVGGAALLTVLGILVTRPRPSAPTAPPVPPSDPPRLELPRVTIPKDKSPNKPPEKRHPDRVAAEYAIAIGGFVRVDYERTNNIRAAADLPAHPFLLTAADLGYSKLLTDDGLAVFRPCADLDQLSLFATQAGDDGLAHFAGCTRLKHISLGGSRVTDAGLAHLKGCTRLDHLDLSNIRITDAGAAHFKDCRDLGLLSFASTRVGDLGLTYFKDSRRLGVVYLASTAVTDAGLKTLAEIRTLALVDVKDTRVTADGVAELAKALPRCQILWDGGKIVPTKK